MIAPSAEMQAYTGLVPLAFIGMFSLYLIIALVLWIPGFRAELRINFRHDCLMVFKRSKLDADTTWRRREVADLKSRCRRRGQGWLSEGLIGMMILHVPMMGISLCIAITFVSILARGVTQ
jgi:hypothetical protein